MTLGTGAFSSTEADRRMSLNVAKDDAAFLKLEARDGRRAVQSADGTLDFLFPSEPTDDAEGVATDSTYRFGKEYENSSKGLFTIQNQGTQEVGVYSSQNQEETQPSVSIYDVETGVVLNSPEKAVELSPGKDTLYAGIRIDTHGVEVQDDYYELTLTIHAATEEER